ncbi:MAG TPA: GNAT family N-acetyltransferase [Planctomycetota bacterium]|jgi:ribosomal protein S18 acetylase RimI-like enzyme|nr:GNAT family N-acetyltransferase [Planctomycetota bacterium]
MSVLKFNHNPSTAQMQQLHQNLQAYNRQFLPDDRQTFAITATTAERTLVGAAEGVSYWGRLYLDLLWVATEQRGLGVGRQLIAQVEAVARERGNRGVDLWTMTFQAPGFYEKLGYRQVGEIKGYDGGHAKRFYSKELSGNISV